MNDNIKIFDRTLVKHHRDRAALRLHRHDFLFREAARLLNDRLVDGDFEAVLDLGSRGDYMCQALAGKNITTFIQTDLSQAVLQHSPATRVVADEEQLPFARHSFDLVVSALNLHWVNDLPGTLIQIHTILKPGGTLLANLFAGQTLIELRQVMAEAEMQITGGLAPRISPFGDVKTLGALVQRAGLHMPVADSDTLTVSYNNIFELLEDVRGMGEANALIKRGGALSKATLTRMDTLYRQHHPDGEGGIKATFELVTITGLAA